MLVCAPYRRPEPYGGEFEIRVGRHIDCLFSAVGKSTVPSGFERALTQAIDMKDRRVATNHQTHTDHLTLWRSFEKDSILRCPVCRGVLEIAEQKINCLSCSALFPVESGVPLLMRPADVESIPDQVMKIFNIPVTLKEEVEAALTTLTKYRTSSHPEFANFFARFDGSEGQAQTTPLSHEDTAASIEKVACLTQSFPESLRSDKAEFRSLRLKNGSDKVLFTDERYPLCLSYRIFDLNGNLIRFEASRSKLPCPLRPAGELTVPVMVTLPAGLTGQFVVRFYFVLSGGTTSAVRAAAAGQREHSTRDRISAWGGRLRSRLLPGKIARQDLRSPEDVWWFDRSPLVEMTVTAIPNTAKFPAIRRGGLTDFDLKEDVARADGFLLEIIDDLGSRGITKPRILEVGAGVHPISLRNRGNNSTVVVSDISLVMQTLASIMHRENPAVQEGRAAFASFDMMHPPFRDGTFDIICICAALHHISVPEKFLKRLTPLLSAAGRFVALREPCLVSPSEPAYITELSNGFNEQMFELSEWKHIIARGGLTLDRAVIDFGCSLKFSARASSPEEPVSGCDPQSGARH